VFGEIAALAASAIWVMASNLYDSLIKQREISSLQLSLYRGLIALPFLGLSLWVTQDPLPVLSLVQWTCLILSAILGITVGDTAFFFSLKDVGVKKALLLQTLTPVFGTLLAFIFLQEKISSWGAIGIILTLMGIVGVINHRTMDQEASNLIRGIIWGLISTSTQGLGAILLKFVLATTPISPLWSSNIRLLSGIIMVIFWLNWQQESKLMPPLTWGEWFRLSLAAILGTFIGLWLHQTAFKLAPVGIASTLLNTSPLFALCFDLLQKKPVSLRDFVFVVFAMFGISLIFTK
jgi:drug/metabolite transporter (DMT)-like permease